MTHDGVINRVFQVVCTWNNKRWPERTEQPASSTDYLSYVCQQKTWFDVTSTLGQTKTIIVSLSTRAGHHELSNGRRYIYIRTQLKYLQLHYLIVGVHSTLELLPTLINFFTSLVEQAVCWRLNPQWLGRTSEWEMRDLVFRGCVVRRVHLRYLFNSAWNECLNYIQCEWSQIFTFCFSTCSTQEHDDEAALARFNDKETRD